jgi:very-short-patch-repair endonuclease
MVRPDQINRGYELCKICSPKSRGESKVQEALLILGISFKKEFILPGERSRYDFELPDHKIIIETDGIQHFKIGYKYTPTLRDLKLAHYRDVNKMAQANLADYKVVRIDYTYYGKPVEDFVEYIKEIVERPRELLPDFTFTSPSKYLWVRAMLADEFWTDGLSAQQLEIPA